MPAYAKVEDIQARMTRNLSSAELNICEALLEDAGVLIDAFRKDSPAEAKQLVSCRMIIRALGDGDSSVPIGASQGSVSALGYSQSWTMSGGGAGELYLSKTDRQLLGGVSAIGSYSPLQELANTTEVL